MYITTTGLVLRAVPYRETSVILTVLTAAEGKLTVSARGARRRGSKTAASVQPLAFSEMTLSGRNGRWTLTEARSLELFEGLQSDLSLLALGNYFAELAETVCGEEEPQPEVLVLLLNCLFALSEGIREPEMVKAAFELKLMGLLGYEPQLGACRVCGRTEPEKPVLELTGGVMRCAGCGGPARGGEARMCPASLQAARYVLQAPSKKLLSFTLKGEAAGRLARLAEEYALTQLDRGFRSLDYYKNVRGEAE